MYEFKLNYYFEILKDTSFVSRQEFREMFLKKYGKFLYLNELILMIENYQLKKYGSRITSHYEYKTQQERLYDSKREWNRNHKRFKK